jgi:hypothetical protein
VALGLRGSHLYGDKERVMGSGGYGKGVGQMGCNWARGAGGGSHDEVNLVLTLTAGSSPPSRWKV